MTAPGPSTAPLLEYLSTIRRRRVTGCLRNSEERMYFKQFLHDETGCSSYFIASRQSREAAVIDPQFDTQPYLDLASERGFRIVHVIDTHLHADHISGNR